VILEVEVLCHLDDMVFLLWILRYGIGMTDQDNGESHIPNGVDYPISYFNKGLMMEPLLVPNNLDCDGPSCSMILAAQHLSKNEAIHDFVMVAKMVPVDDKIITLIIVIAIVVCGPVRVSRLLCAISPDVVH